MVGMMKAGGIGGAAVVGKTRGVIEMADREEEVIAWRTIRGAEEIGIQDWFLQE